MSSTPFFSSLPVQTNPSARHQQLKAHCCLTGEGTLSGVVAGGLRRLPSQLPTLWAVDPTRSFCKMGAWMSGHPDGQPGADDLGLMVWSSLTWSPEVGSHHGGLVTRGH